ncbi:MAG: type II toxin-antitoxin system HicB family antitoxin [Sulfuricella denitrificans]|nr:type II toxin-antitoxin system HicB family antitoxin [Sulfuricella denitrificans]
MANNDLSYNEYTGSVEVSIEDGCLHGRILFIDDIVTYEAESVSGIQEAFEGAVDRYIALCERSGKPAVKPYSGTFNVRIGPDLHRQAAHAARARGVKLNEFVTLAIRDAVTKNGAQKVEHVHQHFVTLSTDSGKTGAFEPMLAGMPVWESANATVQ